MKKQFIALFWDQKLLHIPNFKYNSRPSQTIEYWGSENVYLELKPLSSITDEDATKVASIVLGKEITPLTLQRWDWRYNIIVNREQSIQDENTEIEMYVNITYDSAEIKFTWDYNNNKGCGQQERHCPNVINAFDYLRMKGYALPWNGITVEELIEKGWIKLI